MAEKEIRIDRNTIIRLFLGFLACVLVIGFYFGLKRLPQHYSAEMIEGWVVDGETKEPLTDVIVIAIWELMQPWGMEGDALAGYIHVAEVLTDMKGHYLFPAWGPKIRRGKTYMGRNDPMIIVFKPEYDYLLLKNRHGNNLGNWDKRYESIHRSDWNGKTVELKKFDGDLEEYAKKLDFLQRSGPRSFYEYGSCKWTMIPNFIQAMGYYKKYFDKAGITSYLPTFEGLVKRDKTRCEKEKKGPE